MTHGRIEASSSSGTLKFADVNLRYVDFGGTGEPVLLLHGLCGTADEWANAAAWLCQTQHVVAFDQRGHGQSTRRPATVTPQAYVNDAVRVMESLELAHAIVIGQSMGGRVALALAAHAPDLVHSLIMVEATPISSSESRENISALLNAWPVPFADRSAAQRFFGGNNLNAKAWADSLEERTDGLWPRFDVDIMLQTVKEFARVDLWAMWRELTQPTLVVGGEKSTSIDVEDLLKMVACVPRATYVNVEGAGHDVHLDRPDEFRQVVSDFLASAS